MMKPLQVPENISLRWEAWRGVGRPELIKSSTITAIALVIAIILAKAKLISTFFAVAIIIFTFAVCISVLSKLENNQSMADYVAKAIRFKKEQQNFMFKNTAEEEVRLNEEKTK